MQTSKLQKLKRIIKGMKRVVIAYSGGLDSTFLLKSAVDTLGRRNVIAVIAKSATYPEREYKSAIKLAQVLKVNHMTIRTKETEDGEFLKNPVNRCYYCKKELFRRLSEIAHKKNFDCILDGFNKDDKKDLRFGSIAGRELGVRSPLAEAGISKKEIRKYSKKLGLPTWNKPSFACLASRLPYGERIAKGKLEGINKAEEILAKYGFKQVRVRLHGNIARIEVMPYDISRFSDIKLCKAIARAFRKQGFSYITVDLEGYRTGSMNEVLNKRERTLK